MNSASDRRAPGTTRIPFDGMVEVGGALGPSFEAQAVDLSEEGMKLRTAYVPEIGQPITCRFEAGQSLSVLAAGEVLWKEDHGDGGAFGIRFTNLDAHSTVALQRIIGMVEDGVLPRAPHGRKVRLHIDGLASPMRARLRGSQATCATAYSELGFLEMGKRLDLEDASSGYRRPALIERVDVEVEHGSRVPQLVVSLRYDDEEATADADADAPPEEAPAHAPGGSLGAMTIEDGAGSDVEVRMNEDEANGPADAVAGARAASDAADAETDEDTKNLKGKVARMAAKVTPAMTQLAKRAKTTIALLAAKAAARRRGSAADVEAPLRRTTAPAPGGGLHTAGRKVVRGEAADGRAGDEPAKPRYTMNKRKAAIAGAVGIAGILAIFAVRKPAAEQPVATAPQPETTAAATAAPAAPGPVAPPNDPLAAAAANGPSYNGAIPSPRMRNGKPIPFGNGPIGGHGNVIRIKMDGPVEAIQGASQPTGFTVAIPNRKAAEPAAPLASRDPRIASLNVSNEDQGAELSVTFKDGVPNYQVRARGDVLEIVLARPTANGDAPPPEAHAGHKAHKKHRKHSDQ